MNYLSKLTPEWSLRVGLGVMYLYSGIDIVRHPTAWFWAVRPVFKWFPSGMQASLTQPSFMKNFLVSQGLIEIIFALVLLCWFLPKKFVKLVAALITLEMAGILFLIPIDAVTFRDFGLLGGGLALFLILNGGFKPVLIGSSSSVVFENKIEHKPVKDLTTSSRQAGEPAAETFEEFMGQK